MIMLAVIFKTPYVNQTAFASSHKKTMTRQTILFIISSCISTLTFGQKLGDYYVSISIDSTQRGRLKLLSDTTIELSSVPRHMSPSLSKVYKYITKDSTIEILPDSDVKSDTIGTSLRVKNKLKGINKDKCTIEFVRGLNAYKRFGIKRVYGAIVITTKNYR